MKHFALHNRVNQRSKSGVLLTDIRHDLLDTRAIGKTNPASKRVGGKLLRQSRRDRSRVIQQELFELTKILERFPARCSTGGIHWQTNPIANPRKRHRVT